MTSLLHISASPRGAASESIRIAGAFVDAYRDTHPDVPVETWDLWDGSLPAFGPAAAGAKMTVFGGGTLEDEQGGLVPLGELDLEYGHWAAKPAPAEEAER